MQSYTVTFVPGDRIVQVDEKTTILEAALAAGVFIPAACGGAEACLQCKIKINKGQVEGGGKDKLKPEQWEQGFRLACSSEVVSDIEVEVQGEAVTKTVMEMAAAIEHSLEDLGYDVHPMMKQAYLELDPPQSGENIPDLERVMFAMKHVRGLPVSDASPHVLNQLPAALRKEDFKITANYGNVCLFDPEGENPPSRLTRVVSGKQDDRMLAVAFDLGTTSVWGRLIDVQTGEVVKSAHTLNEQAAVGADVITRIIHQQKADGIVRLKGLALKSLNTVLKGLLDDETLPNLTHMTLAGNTVMCQLLWGIDADSLRKAPYVPAASIFPPVMGDMLGLEVPGGIPLYTAPGVASYVGGDIVAGVLASGFWREPEVTVYIDLGTNGEIVVGNQDFLMCAAASAGPAFEGGGIRCGMRAAPGAIDHFTYVDPENIMTHTIGGGKAHGVCGVGLLDVIAELYQHGLMGQNGKFNPDKAPDLFVEGVDGPEFIIVPKKMSATKEPIVLTEADVDNVIRAKGAIYAAIISLLDAVGMTKDDIGRIQIAGAFGGFLNPARAVEIGLVPNIPTDRFSYLGNGSLVGAELIARSRQAYLDSMKIAGLMTNLELSEDPSYMDKYLQACFIPHTSNDY